jgi:hypothetical protein
MLCSALCKCSQMVDTFYMGLPETSFQMTPTDQSSHDTEICLLLEREKKQTSSSNIKQNVSENTIIM